MFQPNSATKLETSNRNEALWQYRSLDKDFPCHTTWTYKNKRLQMPWNRKLLLRRHLWNQLLVLLMVLSLFHHQVEIEPMSHDPQAIIPAYTKAVQPQPFSLLIKSAKLSSFGSSKHHMTKSKLFISVLQVKMRAITEFYCQIWTTENRPEVDRKSTKLFRRRWFIPDRKGSLAI